VNLLEAHTKKTPLLLFDFDGVIADSFHVFYPCFVDMCRDCGYLVQSEAEFLRLFEDNVRESLLREGFPVDRIEMLAQDFAPRIAVANQQCEPFPKMVSVVSKLAAKCPLVIITSNNTEPVQEFIDRHEITGIRGVLGADIESSKVKKIHTVAREYPQHQPFYIGDTKGDMLEGQRAGAVTVGASWGWHPKTTLAEVSPDYLLDTPDELLDLFTVMDTSSSH